jgi:imidazolonepropionase-like amidohydrolase
VLKNLAGALHAERGGCRLSVGREVKIEIPVQMGTTPIQAIEVTIRNGAEALSMLRDSGAIEPGKLADVIVVAGNPLENMAAKK